MKDAKHILAYTLSMKTKSVLHGWGLGDDVKAIFFQYFELTMRYVLKGTQA